MRGDLIIPGVEYVVSLKPKHILIGETGITYAERQATFPCPSKLHELPHAASRERERLARAMGGGLQSRILRCPTLVVDRKRIGTVCTVVDRLPKQRVLVECDFRAQRDAHTLDDLRCADEPEGRVRVRPGDGRPERGG